MTTARALLEAKQPIDRQLTWSHETTGVPPGLSPLYQLAPGQATSLLTQSIASALDIPLGELLLLGWNRIRLLREHALSTEPDTLVLVPLSEHTVESTHTATIAFTAEHSDVDLFRIDIGVVLAVELEALMVGVQDGKAMRIHPGRVRLTAKLTLHDLPMVELESDWEQPEQSWPLGHNGRGIDLA